MSRPPELLIVAGEVSGDMHAALLVQAIKRRIPEARVYGIGGDRLQAAGVETFYHVRDMAVMGFVEVLRHIGFFRRVFYHLRDVARERRPDAVILVDYPGFNLRFAAEAHAMGLKVMYYICPQVWAWNRRRIPRMAAIVDRLLAIFPFEKEVFAGTPLRVDFVGHPLVDEIREALSQPPVELPWNSERSGIRSATDDTACHAEATQRRKVVPPRPYSGGTGSVPSVPQGASSADPRVAILPGSRKQEIERILPALCGAAAIVAERCPGASFIVPTPSAEATATVRAVLGTLPRRPARLEIVEGATRQVLRQARAAWVASGTATLEAALLDCPTVVVYKAAPMTYFLAKRLVKLPDIGIVNVIARRRICPELIQEAATPARLAEALVGLLEDGPARGEMLKGFAEVRALLGEGGAAERAAERVLEELALPRRK